VRRVSRRSGLGPGSDGLWRPAETTCTCAGPRPSGRARSSSPPAHSAGVGVCDDRFEQRGRRQQPDAAVHPCPAVLLVGLLLNATAGWWWASRSLLSSSPRWRHDRRHHDTHHDGGDHHRGRHLRHGMQCSGPAAKSRRQSVEQDACSLPGQPAPRIRPEPSDAVRQSSRQSVPPGSPVPPRPGRSLTSWLE
jgi:hypothetical protein